jgi:predicted transcriptional regulator
MQQRLARLGIRHARDKPWMIREAIEALMRLRGIECRSPTGYAEAFHGRKIVVGC